MTTKQILENIMQPLALGSFRNWLSLIIQNKIDEPFISRAIFVSFASLATFPLRAFEWIHFTRRISKTEIKQPPVFIIGHWRSGTTFLHDLMTQDQNLGFVSTLQTIAPQAYLVGDKTVKPFLARILPPTRIMDNMHWSMDSPQEEEFAIANMSPYSFYHHWSFPRRIWYYFKRYVLFQGVPEKLLIRWKKVYMNVLRKATYRMGNRRLVLKNPTNTARIGLLLELFPQAKFIHIYRNPYRVFQSTRHLFCKTLPVTQLQEISQEDIDRNILRLYKEIMKKFLEEKKLIPADNLIEIRFEDLEEDPSRVLEKIYTQLNLPGYPEAVEGIKVYLASRSNYKKNRYSPPDREVIALVNRHWRFALEEWGYPVLTN